MLTRAGCRRKSNCARTSIISVSKSKKFLAWCCPDYFDKDLGSQAFLAYIQDSSFVNPHNKLCINRIKEENSLIFSLKLVKESRLQDFIIGRSEPAWAYINADTFSALSSKGKSIQLPLSGPSASSGFSRNVEEPNLEDVPDSLGR